jgi:hypothetical protein
MELLYDDRAIQVERDTGWIHRQIVGHTDADLRASLAARDEEWRKSIANTMTWLRERIDGLADIGPPGVARIVADAPIKIGIPTERVGPAMIKPQPAPPNETITRGKRPPIPLTAGRPYLDEHLNG